MASLRTSTNKKGRGRKFSIHEDIRKPLAIFSHNINRNNSGTEKILSHISDESKKAISVLINKHEQTKSELESKITSEKKMKTEVEELRAQVQDLHCTIKDDLKKLEELNSRVELGIQESSTLPDTQEALLENLIAKEGVIDRELFNLRDDKVQTRAELWFAMMGKVDESMEHPDQASRDRNLLMRKEMYIRTKRSIAQDTKAQLLLAKEDIQKQKLEISKDDHVEGYAPLRPASSISQDSDEGSIVPDSHLEEYPVENSIQHQDTSWVMENGEESSNVLDHPFGQQNQTEEDNDFAAIEEGNQTEEYNDFSPIEENRRLKLELQTTEEKIRKWEGKFDRFRFGTKATIERLASEVSTGQETLREYKAALNESYDTRGQLVHSLAKAEKDRAHLFVVAEEIGLPILARSAENMKRVKRDGIYTSLDNSHLRFNEDIVRAGNLATTGGHINAHFASIALSAKGVVSSPVISHEMFRNMYGVSVGEYRHFYKVSERLDEIFDMHAILVECGSFTEKTLSKARDALFRNQFSQCLIEFEAIDAPTTVDKGKIFDAEVRSNQFEMFNEMIRIVQEMKNLQRDVMH
ncbi:6b122a0a-29d7-4952-b99e-39f02300f49b [Sclerotinia trifoliorum]|uniref:6b122a0a-29d7-4952-b99e-39f02300f49b n=1 Tax=Sclerotinia trifoliorum TaxID=28548 RepID=A0A8H2ZTW1_9HELO|nr:6b122a0a-29d7-4952-b99e-39f02300f49b [Sclerotinia trifoliorum]